jgi:unsaturated pyranuronate lyase
MSINDENFIADLSTEWKEIDNGVERKICGYNDNLMMVKVHFSKGSVGTLHKHHHSQATYVAKGKFEVQIGREKKVMSEGDSFYIPPDVEHGVISLEDGLLIDAFNPKRDEFLI